MSNNRLQKRYNYRRKSRGSIGKFKVINSGFKDAESAFRRRQIFFYFNIVAAGHTFMTQVEAIEYI